MKDHVAVFMLDVGQGDSTIVLLPDERVVIFDCADDHVLRKILENWNTQTIAAFVLSHLDQDHIAGALQFLKKSAGSIDAVYVSADRDISDDHKDAKRAKKLVDYVVEQSRSKGARRRRWELHPNTRDARRLASGADWSVTLLAPPHGQQLQREREGSWEDANRHSSILRVQVGSRTMLIGADAPLLSWSELPAEELTANVFRIPHHGGALDDGGIPAGWSVERLYKEVNAETALVSVGTNNAYGHPRKDWMNPISGGACRLLCTQVTARCHADLDVLDSDGKVTRNTRNIEDARQRVITRQNQWTEPQYRHLLRKPRTFMRGLQSDAGSTRYDTTEQEPPLTLEKDLLEVPCAGTVIVKLYLNGKIEVLPARGGGHERIVDDWQHPLCRPPDP